MFMNKAPLIGLVALGSYVSIHAQDTTAAQLKVAQWRATLAKAAVLPLKREEVTIQLPSRDGVLGGRIMSVASDRKAELTYVLVRADKDHQSILVVDRGGRIVRSWGKGLFTVAHNIKIDSEGNVWTTDTGDGHSKVIEFNPEGKKLMEFALGDPATSTTGGCAFPPSPHNGNLWFCGITDIIVTPNKRIFVSDGYGKERVLEYSATGDKRIREWGGQGTGPGKFILAHGLAYDGKDVLFASDRNGGRIERFNLEGSYLGEWNNLGYAGSLAYAQGALWALIAPGPPSEPANARPNVIIQTPLTGQPGSWVIKIDPSTGTLLGKLEATGGTHFLDVNENGEVIAGASTGGFFRYSPDR